MSVPNELSDKYFFHFSHLENLDSIVKNGLLCTNRKTELGIDHLNVASTSIQARRSSMEVTCGPKGTVHDYVPFYLCSTNPMFLSLVNQKNVDQPFVIFFAISIDYVNRDSVVFSDASANTSAPPNFFHDPADLDQLDWEAIGNTKWGRGTDDELHRRMAEVLVHEKVPIEDIEYIVVWNNNVKDEVQRIFNSNNVKCPPIEFTPFKRVYRFHFTKWMLGRPGETLVTGPFFLKKKFEVAIENIKNNRKKNSRKTVFKFESVEEALNSIDDDFSAISELGDIFELETLNAEHSENVSDHTKSVVKNVVESEFYQESDEEAQRILKLSAYLHDIGKGPKSMWKDGKQKTYVDHPADAPGMLERILSEDIQEISDYEIRMICLLVTYHDLIGEIIGKNRDVQQLYDILENEKEFDMLSCLNYADVQALNFFWVMQYRSKIGSIKSEFLEQLD